MKYNQFIGVDVSKRSLDITLLDKGCKGTHVRIPNTAEGIQTWLESGAFTKKSIFCLESTGVYGHLLLRILSSKKYHAWVVSPVHIKRSQGLTRGKSDKVDSLRIAEFARTHVDQVNLYKPVRSVIK